MATVQDRLGFITAAADTRLGTLADQLGATRARIRALKKHEAEVTKALRDSGAECAIGNKYRITITRREQESLDTKTLREVMPRKLWARFLKVAEQVRLTVTPIA